jgi:hypothetical protein
MVDVRPATIEASMLRIPLSHHTKSADEAKVWHEP